MFAVYAARVDADDPLSGLELGEQPEPERRDGWATVSVRAASLNHHDLWSLRGVGLSAEQLPMILGCDAAGIDEAGNEVVVHSVIGEPTGVATRRSTRRGRSSPSGIPEPSPSASPCRRATSSRSRPRSRSMRRRACRRRG